MGKVMCMNMYYYVGTAITADLRDLNSKFSFYFAIPDLLRIYSGEKLPKTSVNLTFSF